MNKAQNKINVSQEKNPVKGRSEPGISAVSQISAVQNSENLQLKTVAQRRQAAGIWWRKTRDQRRAERFRLREVACD